MVRLGWFKDVHQAPADSAAYDGPGRRFVEDLRDAFEERGASEWVMTGDAGHPAEDVRGDVPHVDADAYETFWRLVCESGRYDDLVAAVPGNHDVPLETFLDSDPKATLNAVRRYDGVTVVLLNTVGTGFHTGSPSPPDTPGGYGVDYGYVPYATLEWLDERLRAAGDDVKLVFPHHHLYFQSDPDVDRAYSPADQMRSEQSYWVVLNHRAVHRVLSRHGKVVVPQSHLYQFETETVRTLDGVR